MSGAHEMLPSAPRTRVTRTTRGPDSRTSAQGRPFDTSRHRSRAALDSRAAQARRRPTWAGDARSLAAVAGAPSGMGLMTLCWRQRHRPQIDVVFGLAIRDKHDALAVRATRAARFRCPSSASAAPAPAMLRIRRLARSGRGPTAARDRRRGPSAIRPDAQRRAVRRASTMASARRQASRSPARRAPVLVEPCRCRSPRRDWRQTRCARRQATRPARAR